MPRVRRRLDLRVHRAFDHYLSPARQDDRAHKQIRAPPARAAKRPVAARRPPGSPSSCPARN